jgi:hypothetical protein
MTEVFILDDKVVIKRGRSCDSLSDPDILYRLEILVSGLVLNDKIINQNETHLLISADQCFIFALKVETNHVALSGYLSQAIR